MKIAITGHTAGIGQAFAKILADRGHEIVGLSRRHGDNIRNTVKIVEKIAPCDRLSYVASLLNLLKIYRNQVCVKEIQI